MACLDRWGRVDDCRCLVHDFSVCGYGTVFRNSDRQIFLWLFGGFVLIYSGVESVLRVNTILLNQYRNKDSLISCFLTGFIMSVTSPLSILFWLGIYGSVLAKTASTYGTSQLFIYSGMIFLGLTCWDFFVAALTNGFRRFLNERSLMAISIISGLSWSALVFILHIKAFPPSYHKAECFRLIHRAGYLKTSSLHNSLWHYQHYE
ncbi:LysE type translocator [Peribacillus simplex]|uniref:LysE type translocator n=1 Tax=Peribacillus simplex TaxID=1478 RepID=A0A9X8WGS8_9BACI|nr:LysE type translocator [Peribacillus simplex]